MGPVTRTDHQAVGMGQAGVWCLPAHLAADFTHAWGWANRCVGVQGLHWQGSLSPPKNPVTGPRLRGSSQPTYPCPLPRAPASVPVSQLDCP